MQTRQARRGEAFPPEADGVAVAAEFGRNLLVGRPISVGSPQDESAAEDQGLRGGACPDQGLELLAEFIHERDRRAKGTRHEKPPCGGNNRVRVRRLIVRFRYPLVQVLAANL